MIPGRGAAVGDSGLPVRSPERLALTELPCLDPPAGNRVPEQVAAGGVDNRDLAMIAGLEVIQVGVVVDQDRSNGLGRGPSGLCVGRQDLLAGLELADRDSGTGGEQNLGARGEAHPAAGRCSSAFFCGYLVVNLAAGAKFRENGLPPTVRRNS